MRRDDRQSGGESIHRCAGSRGAPNDLESNYSVSLVYGMMIVGQAIPAITWTNPVPVIYGTVLGPAQLAATSDVPGSFAYTPTNGTVLDIGTNSLSVLFTPADTVDYSTANDTANLIVSPALLTIASGIAANNKIFDGTAVATLSISNVSFSGIISGETLSVNTNGYIASFASAGVGDGHCGEPSAA